MNVAVYGGSFDPPHLSHVMIAAHLLMNDDSVDRVLVVPCFQQNGKNLTDFEHREAMCRMAFGWLPLLEVSTVERDLGGESLSLRTMRHLKETHPEWNLRFVMGRDVYERGCGGWAGWDDLVAIAPPLVVGRAGISPEKPGDPTPIAPAVSSTIIRNALATGDHQRAARYVPAEVLAYIRKHNLYHCGV